MIYIGSLIKASTYKLIGDPPWSMGAVDAFEAEAHRKITMLHFGLPWMSTGESWTAKYGGYYPFNAALFSTLWQRGIVPMCDWGSADLGASIYKTQPKFALAAIIAGKHDAYVSQWADAARTYGAPILLRLNWEMNGSWYPWSEQANGNKAGEYVAAWRHIVDLFRMRGANNVNWVWCPNVLFAGATPLAGLYPGDDYVHWVGMDGYNKFTADGTAWRSPYNLFHETYEALRSLAPNKPMMIGETGCNEAGDGGAKKAAWLLDLLQTQLPLNFPAVAALLYFNWDDRNPAEQYPIGTTALASAAFATGAASSYYAPAPIAPANGLILPYQEPLQLQNAFLQSQLQVQSQQLQNDAIVTATLQSDKAALQSTLSNVQSSLTQLQSRHDAMRQALQDAMLRDAL